MLKSVGLRVCAPADEHLRVADGTSPLSSAG